MEALYLGVGRTIITPDVGGHLYGYDPTTRSTCVNDDLTATAFWFKQGTTEVLMISVTACYMATVLSDRLLNIISETYNINKQHIQIACTHTHSGPNLAKDVGWGDIDTPYVENRLIPQLMAAVKEAKDSTVPVTMAVAQGESRVAVNRRELTAENYIAFGQNPWGPFDPTMTLLSFKDESGTVIANMVHYGCHGTCAGHNTEITRDWSGVMIDALEKHLGGTTAFFCGPEGDVGPRLSNGKTVGDLQLMKEHGEIAASDIVRISKKLGEYTTVPLRVANEPISIPFKARISRDEAQAALELYDENSVNWQALVRNHALRVVEAWENNDAPLTALSFDQSLIGLGNIVFAASPFELFSEIGLRIKRAFTETQVLSLVCTNGGEGYFVTEDALVRGGYEVRVFLHRHIQAFCQDADFAYIRATIDNVKKLGV